MAKSNISNPILLQMKCPSCGAQLDINTDSDIMYCSHCGEKIFLENDVRIKARVEIEKDKNKYAYKKQVLDHKAAEQKLGLKLGIGLLVFGTLIPCSILGGFAISDHAKEKELKQIESQVEEYYLAGNYDAALFKANQLVFNSAFSSSDEWDQKREAWIDLINKANEDGK